MEQLYLFAPEEIIRNNAMKALINGEFHRSGKHWMELKNLNSGNDFVNVALDICHYWMEECGDDEEFRQESPLEVYKKWRFFEQYLNAKAYRNNPVIGAIKENIFLSIMGLANPTPLLHQSFEKYGITVLDLLMEIEKWQLAVREISNIGNIDVGYEKEISFLKCSKVYYKAGKINSSRRFLLHAFWNQPDLIALDDIADPELLNGLPDLYPDYRISEDSVELIPFVILMTGAFSIRLADCQNYLTKLRRSAEIFEKNRNSGTKIRHRLFSLYAWDAELSKLINLDFIGARNEMKSLDNQLFQHYIAGVRNLEGRTLITTG
jgi:hypothetical protein